MKLRGNSVARLAAAIVSLQIVCILLVNAMAGHEAGHPAEAMLSSLLWVVAIVADIWWFPTARMTRYVITQCLPVALVMATVNTLFSIYFQDFWFSVLAFISGGAAFTALVTLVLLFTERRRVRRAAVLA